MFNIRALKLKSKKKTDQQIQNKQQVTEANSPLSYEYPNMYINNSPGARYTCPHSSKIQIRFVLQKWVNSNAKQMLRENHNQNQLNFFRRR